MIPVAAQHEPADFDAKVRKKGLAHLAKKGFALNQPLPPKADIEPYWRVCALPAYELYKKFTLVDATAVRKENSDDYSEFAL